MQHNYVYNDHFGLPSCFIMKIFDSMMFRESDPLPALFLIISFEARSLSLFVFLYILVKTMI